jgi:hypothetical protein
VVNGVPERVQSNVADEVVRSGQCGEDVLRLHTLEYDVIKDIWVGKSRMHRAELVWHSEQPGVGVRRTLVGATWMNQQGYFSCELPRSGRFLVKALFGSCRNAPIASRQQAETDKLGGRQHQDIDSIPASNRRGVH